MENNRPWIQPTESSDEESSVEALTASTTARPASSSRHAPNASDRSTASNTSNAFYGNNTQWLPGGGGGGFIFNPSAQSNFHNIPPAHNHHGYMTQNNNLQPAQAGFFPGQGWTPAPGQGFAASPAQGLSAANTEPEDEDEFLHYPHDFLSLDKGLGPKNEAAAARLWSLRKLRPKKGEKEEVTADGAVMMAEIEGMRVSLKQFAVTSFWTEAKQMSELWGLVVPATQKAPITPRDFYKALGSLSPTKDSLKNESIVYMVCHHFHHQTRGWNAQIVDAWCKQEKIKIDFPTEKKPKKEGTIPRASPSGRGGFSAHVRNTKCDVVKKLMGHMLKNAGWCIATRRNEEQSDNRKHYEKISVRIPSAGTSHPCYVVTDTGEASSSRPAASRSVDPGQLLNFGAHLCSTFGISLSEDKLKELWNQFNPASVDVVGTTVDVQAKAPGDGDVSQITTDALTPEDTANTKPAAIDRSPSAVSAAGTMVEGLLAQQNHLFMSGTAAHPPAPMMMGRAAFSGGNVPWQPPAQQMNSSAAHWVNSGAARPMAPTTVNNPSAFYGGNVPGQPPNLMNSSAVHQTNLNAATPFQGTIQPPVRPGGPPTNNNAFQNTGLPPVYTDDQLAASIDASMASFCSIQIGCLCLHG